MDECIQPLPTMTETALALSYAAWAFSLKVTCVEAPHPMAARGGGRGGGVEARQAARVAAVHRALWPDADAPMHDSSRPKSTKARFYAVQSPYQTGRFALISPFS